MKTGGVVICLNYTMFLNFMLTTNVISQKNTHLMIMIKTLRLVIATC